MKKKSSYLSKGIFHIVRVLVRLFYGKVEIVGRENLPEKNEKYNNILYNFKENFVDLARLFYKKTGKNINFVPIYLAPKLKKVYIGRGIEYCGEKDSKEEKNVSSLIL